MTKNGSSLPPISQSFPSSNRVLHSEAMPVPAREIQLAGGAPPLKVYDTSGPAPMDG